MTQRELFGQVGEPEPADEASAAEVEGAKRRHPGMVLVFHLGDDYVIADPEDCERAAALGVPHRFPVKGMERPLRVLLKAGLRVAICEKES